MYVSRRPRWKVSSKRSAVEGGGSTVRLSLCRRSVIALGFMSHSLLQPNMPDAARPSAPSPTPSPLPAGRWTGKEVGCADAQLEYLASAEDRDDDDEDRPRWKKITYPELGGPSADPARPCSGRAIGW